MKYSTDVDRQLEEILESVHSHGFRRAIESNEITGHLTVNQGKAEIEKLLFEYPCNSPYHFDLGSLSSYGIDELNDAVQSILAELLVKQYHSGYNYAMRDLRKHIDKLTGLQPSSGDGE